VAKSKPKAVVKPGAKPAAQPKLQHAGGADAALAKAIAKLRGSGDKAVAKSPAAKAPR
jgi:hypothetical protein